MLARMQAKGTLIPCWWNCKLEQSLCKPVWKLCKQLKIDHHVMQQYQSYGYTQQTELAYNKSTCTPMFIAALFTIAKLWKQPWCPTINEWIKKIWYLYTIKFYSATKKNEILPFTCKWMELENVILSEINQDQKVMSHMFSLICSI
jgi:hypothetical protein